MISDLKVAAAWTYPGHIVLTGRLLDTLDDGELSGVIAHELSHWLNGDPIGLAFVSACAWPITAIYNMAARLGGQRLAEDPEARQQASLRNILIWFIFWPTWTLLRFLIGPAAAARARKHEFHADADAVRAGFGPGLESALEKLTAYEPARTGFEAVILTSHPPVKLRLDALRPAEPGDEDRQQSPAGVLTERRLKIMGLIAGVALAGYSAGGALVRTIDNSSKPLSGYRETTAGAEQAASTFATRFIDVGPNAVAAKQLIDSSVMPASQNGVLAEYQQLASGYNTAISGGVDATITANTLGCEATLNSDGADVGIHENLVLREPPGPAITLNDSVLVNMQWTATGWKVVGYSERPLGTSGWPTQFTSCPPNGTPIS